jgi:hypothetical protein
MEKAGILRCRLLCMVGARGFEAAFAKTPSPTIRNNFDDQAATTCQASDSLTRIQEVIGSNPIAYTSKIKDLLCISVDPFVIVYQLGAIVGTNLLTSIGSGSRTRSPPHE